MHPLSVQLNAILRENTRPPLRLVKLHNFTDAMITAQAAQLGAFACKPGCSYCCNFPVPVSQLEAQRLAQASGRKLTVPTDTVGPFTDPRPCPFLNDNLCSVYDSRPMACRTYNVLKADAAHSEVDCTSLSSAEEYGSAQLRATAAPPPLLMALVELAKAANQPPGLADIRDWFPAR